MSLPRLRILLVLPSLVLGACATWEPRPLPRGLLELSGVEEPDPPRRAVLGVEVSPNESDSLEDLEVRPGVRIRAIAPDSPAAEVGLRVGDVLLAFDGTPTDDPGRLVALLRAIPEARPATLRVERDTRVFEVEVKLRIRNPGATQHTLYFIDRKVTRAAFRDGRGSGALPVIVRLAPDSPLRKAGAEEGWVVRAFQGRDPGSARELVRRLQRELRPGEEGRLTVEPPGTASKEIRFHAWSPGRELVAFSLWPLWTWTQRPEEAREHLVIGDLILFSLFRMDRLGEESSCSILSLLHWKTGEAVLGGTPLPMPEKEDQ